MTLSSHVTRRLACGLIVAAFAAGAGRASAEAGTTAWDALRAGGIVLFRHAIAPGQRQHSREHGKARCPSESWKAARGEIRGVREQGEDRAWMVHWASSGYGGRGGTSGMNPKPEFSYPRAKSTSRTECAVTQAHAA